MKLIMAIVNNDDSSAVAGKLTAAGYPVTKLATTGGFLRAGNTTFIAGVNDDRVDDVIDIISSHSKKRTQILPSTGSVTSGHFPGVPVEVQVGGATIFVMNIERMEKC